MLVNVIILKGSQLHTVVVGSSLLPLLGTQLPRVCVKSIIICIKSCYTFHHSGNLDQVFVKLLPVYSLTLQSVLILA